MTPMDMAERTYGAGPFPPILVNDEPMLRAEMTRLARQAGHEVAEDATLTVRVVEEHPDTPPEFSIGPALFAEIEVFRGA